MRGRFTVSAGFAVLLAALLFLDEGNLIFWALFACLLHELGHYLAIRALGGRLSALRLSVAGAEMTPARGRMFSYREELLILAAGPLASLLAAGGSALLAELASAPLHLFCGINLLLALFNLLPILPLDGGRLLRILLAVLAGEARSLRICTAVTLLLSASLLYLGIHLCLRGGNISLALTALWLLGGQGEASFFARKKRRKAGRIRFLS